LLRFVARPIVAPGASTPQRLQLLLNREWIDTIQLQPGFARYSATLPAAALRLGANTLEVRYERDDAGPREWGASDPAVAWDWLRFGPRQDTPPALPEAVPEPVPSVKLPAGSQLSYYLILRPGSQLRWDAVESSGAGAVRLQILASQDGQRASTLLDLTLPGDNVPTGLAIPGEGPTRLTVRAIGADAPTALILRAPRIEGASKAAPGPARSAPAARPETAVQRRPNILVYLVDTLRADHLGIYGYPLDTSPRLDQFAHEAITFEHAYTQSGWTRTSVASIVSGLLPTAHGVYERTDALDPEAPTLAALLHDVGYETVGYTTNGNVSAAFGFGTGYDQYVHLPEQDTPQIHVQSEQLHREFLGWLRQRDPSEPFFAYLHSSDPHAPYEPPSPFRERFPSPGHTGIDWFVRIGQLAQEHPEITPQQLRQDMVPLYDAEIAHNDTTFGDLLDSLRDMNLYDDTVIVFVSDHGEEFFDHGSWEHGRTLHSEIIRTPLLIKLPGQHNGGARVVTPAQHIDLLPTLLQLAGAPALESAQGRSLVPVLETPASTLPPIAIRSYLALDGHSAASLVSQGLHLLRAGVPGSLLSLSGSRLYDAINDIGEHDDLSETRPVETGLLLTRLLMAESTDRLLLRTGQVEISPEMAERLRALGYIR